MTPVLKFLLLPDRVPASASTTWLFWNAQFETDFTPIASFAVHSASKSALNNEINEKFHGPAYWHTKYSGQAWDPYDPQLFSFPFVVDEVYGIRQSCPFSFKSCKEWFPMRLFPSSYFLVSQVYEEKLEY